MQKTFSKKEPNGMGVGGCLFDVLHDYLGDKKQFARTDYTSSNVISTTNGVLRGSLHGPLLFCYLSNDLSDIFHFNEPYLFADDLKGLAIGNSQSDVQVDIIAIDRWVGTNHMQLQIDERLRLKICGTEKKLHFAGKLLEIDSEVKDPGVTISIKLSWAAHLNNRLKIANRFFYSIRRNLAFRVNTFIKLASYKLIILPILLNGLDCLTLAKSDHQNLENF